MRARMLVSALVLLPVLAACSSQQETYCSAVEDHQTELTELIGAGGQDSLIQALDLFDDLQSKAPGDIADEWQQLVSRIRALEKALDAAGVDPATYDRSKPPAGLSAQEKAGIDAAARELGSGTTLQALTALEQQARDVCHTPLFL